MPSKRMTILAVDDDVYILRMLKRMMELEGYDVLTADNGESALEVFAEKSPDLVLLDIMMPKMDGFTACKRIREFSSVPIIIITAKDSVEEMTKGLELGADDYVTKPFSSTELTARVKATLRRSQAWGERKAPAFRIYDLSIDFTSHLVILGGEEVELTATEYRILSYLAQNAGRVVTPDSILNRVWGDDYAGENHMLQVNIARLRKKLNEDPQNPKYIITRPGIGYMMAKPT